MAKESNLSTDWLEEALRRLENEPGGGKNLQELLQNVKAYRDELATERSRLVETVRLLKSSRDRYAELYQLAPLPHLTLDESGLVLELNLTAAQFLSAAREELEGTPLLPRVADRHRAKLLDHLRRCRSGEDPVVTELCLGPSGRLVELLSKPSPDTAPQPRYRTAIIDLTDRSQKERDLRIAQQRLAAAVEASRAGVFDHAIPITNGCYQNERWAEILGFRVDELPPADELEKWFFKRIHPGDRQRFEAAYRVLASGLTDGYRIEIRMRRKDGKWIWVRGLAKAFDRDPGGRPTRVVGILLDVTEEKKRTLEAEKRVSQLRALASELFEVEERERRQIASDLHDDLGQILVAARMKLDVLRAARREPELDRSLEELSTLLDRADQSVRSVIFQASPPILHDLGLVPALERLARDLESQYRLRVDIETEIDLPPVDPKMRFMLFRSIRELLINVAKHAGVGSARLFLETSRDRNRFEIRVEDDGKGFDPAKGMVPSGVAGATRGFGLFSIKERLESIGGRLEVDSAPDEGCRVSIFAPLRPVTAGEPAVPSGDLAAARLPTARRGASPHDAVANKIRVLLADDHKVVRSALASMLTAQPDIEIVGEASDGAMVLELAHRVPVDVVVMDVSMPGLNGIEATRRLLEELPHLRVIGLSMHEGDDMAAAMCQAGAATYLTKTGPAYTLISAIRAVHAGITSS